VPAGEPLVTLSAHRPDRLVGFLRQPLTTSPGIGTKVEVRRRSDSRVVAAAAVLAVGHALESIPAVHLAPLNRAGQPELGLRIEASIPPGFVLHSGEFVDVFLRF